MITLPREVSAAIERYWFRWSPEVHIKHIKLTDWTAIVERDIDAFQTLIDYAKKHPIEYMIALVYGYEIEEGNQ